MVVQAEAQQGIPRGKANQGHMVSSFPSSHLKTFRASREGLEVDFLLRLVFNYRVLKS